MTSKAGAGLFSVLMGLFLLISTASADLAPTPPTNPNAVEFWEYELANDGIVAECYKHPNTGSNDHGGVFTDESGKTYIVLNEFNQDWFGDHWALLIVKGGSEGGDGNGNATYSNPVAGAHYYPPLNNGGQIAGVSHWIVCKGETVITTTTTSTSTTVQETTTTSSTVPETTTTSTTVPETTTTSSTVPETTTTSTTVPETTTTSSTVPETTTTSSTVLDVPDTPDTPLQELPRTGASLTMLILSAGLIVVGGGILIYEKFSS